MPFKFENKDQEIEFNNGAKDVLGLLFEQDKDFANYATTRAGVEDPQASQLAAGPEQPSLDPLAFGFVDEQGNATEKGQVAFNLKEAGLLDDNLKLTQKGLAFSLTDDEVFDTNRVDLFKIRDESGIGKTPGEGPTFGEMVGTVGELVWDAVTFLGVQTSNEVKGIWNETDKTAAAAGQIALAEQTIADAKALGEIAKVGVAQYAKMVSGTPVFGGAPGASVPGSMMSPYMTNLGTPLTANQDIENEVERRERSKFVDDYYWKARFDRAKNDHYLQNAKDGQILRDYISFDSAVEVMANAKEELGTKRYEAIVKKGKAWANIFTDTTNIVPLQFAIKGARAIPLISRATAYASRRLDNLSLMLKNQATIKEGAEIATATIARNQDQLDTVNRIIESLDKRVEIDPSLQPRLDKARELQSTITNRLEKLNGSLGELNSTGTRLADQIAKTQASLPTKASEVLLGLAEQGRKAKRLPFNVVASTTERVGKGLVKLDDGLSSIAERFGLDKAYELFRSGIGQTGLYGAGAFVGPAGPMIGAGFTVLRSGRSLQNFGKFTRSIGEEVAKARGQIPFWQRVANHAEISPAHKATAHLLDTATLGGAIPGAIRRTSRGVVASYPVDLAFEYLYSEPGEDFTDISKRAAAESLVIGGSASALGGLMLGSNTRHKQLAVGDEINLRNDLSPENRALFSTLNTDLRRSIATYSAVNPALKFKFSTSGNSFYDPSSQTVMVNINSTNPLKPLLAHEVMHHVVDRNQMEGGIAAMLVGDGERGGILRDADGNLDPEFQSFMDGYNKRMVDSGLQPIPQDVAAVEFYIEQSADRVAAMAGSGAMGRISSKTNVRRALDSIIEATLPKLPIISNLHFALGGKMDQAGMPVKGSGLFSKAMQEIPAVRNMTRSMLNRSGGRAFGGFEPLGVEAGDSGVRIPVQKGDRAVLDGLISIFETQEVNGRTVPVYDKNGDPVMLNQATDAARAKAGLKIAEIYESLGRERKPGELFMAEDGTWSGTFIGDDVIKRLADSGIFNKEQIRILRNINSATRNFTGARFTVVNHPATKRVGKKVRYATLAPTLRDVVPVSITISKDGNILVGLMSVTKLQENIVNRSRSKRGRSLYDGNTEQIRLDVGAVMDLHRQNQTTDQYFNDKYGITKGKEYKNFINTVFGLVGGKEQQALNPLFDADKVKSRDQVYRTYRLDRISQATRMTGETAVNMPFVYDAVKLNLFPNGLPTLDEQGNPVAGRKMTPEVSQPEQDSQSRFIPEKLDADYMEAVESGDIDTAQRLVNEAAKAAGFNQEAWHYSGSEFTTFDLETARTSSDVQGFFFRDTRDPNKEYGDKEYHVFIRLQNPANRSQLMDGFSPGSTDDAGIRQRQKLQEQGFDGVLISKEEGEMDYAEIIAFDPSQVKSADPIIRDDNGNIIPPSKRFDITSKDLRFMPEGDSSTQPIKQWNPNPIVATNKAARAKGIPERITDELFELIKNKPIVVGMADLLGAGGKIRGVDVSGGPGYPIQNFNPSNPDAITGVWASERGGINTILQNMVKTDSIWQDESGHNWALFAPHTMAQSAHKSNAQTPEIYISKVNDMAISGALKKATATDLSDHIRANVPTAKDMPNIGTEKLTKFIHDAAFETRAAIMSELSNVRSRDLGAPSPETILTESRDPQYHGVEKNALTGLLLIDVDRLATKDENGNWKLRNDLSADDFNVPKHPSYGTVMPGRVLVHFDNPVPFRISTPEMINTMRKASPLSRIDYLLARMPKGKGIKFQPLTDQIKNAINEAQDISGNVPYIREAVKAVNGNWKKFTSGASLKGLSELIGAIHRSPARDSLTQYTLSDLQKMIKEDKMEVHQLGDNDIWFGVKKSNDGNELVSVVNNTGIPGMLNLIMQRALEVGVNKLDAYAVPTPKTPNGLLPSLYKRYGWKEVERMPFDRQYLVERKKGEKKSDHEAKIAQKEAALKMFWTEQGWDGQSNPDVVFMTYEKGRKTEITSGQSEGSLVRQRIAESGTASATTSGEVRGAGLVGGREQATVGGPTQGDSGTSEGVLPRGFDSIVQSLRSASPIQIETIGITDAERKQFLKKLGVK